MADYQYVDAPICENVQKKQRSRVCIVLEEIGDLKIVVFTDNEPRSHEIWNSMFRNDVEVVISTEFDLIPLPKQYHAVDYDRYVNELRTFVRSYLANKGVIGDVLDLGSEAFPKLNLLLANRKIKAAEFSVAVRQLVPKGIVRQGSTQSTGSEKCPDDTTSLGSTGSSECDLEVRRAFGTSEAGSSGTDVDLARLTEQLRIDISSSMMDVSEASAKRESSSSGAESSKSQSIRNVEKRRLGRLVRENSSSVEEVSEVRARKVSTPSSGLSSFGENVSEPRSGRTTSSGEDLPVSEEAPAPDDGGNRDETRTTEESNK